MQENFYYQYYDWQMQDNLRKNNRREIKKWGLLLGVCVLSYIILNNIFNILLTLSPLYELYLQSDVVESAVDIISSVIAVFLPFFILSISKKQNLIKNINFSKPKSAKTFWYLIIAGFGACILANFAASWLSVLFSAVGFYPNSGSAEFSAQTTVFGFFFYSIRTAILPALIEEFAVRGIMMQPLRKYGDSFAIITSSFIFALMHGNFVQGFFAFLVGCVLGYVVVVTGTLWTGVIIHFINNMFSVTIAGVGLIGATAANITYWVIAIAAVALGIFLIIKYFMSQEVYRLERPVTYLTDGQKLGVFLANPPMILSVILLTVTAIINLV